MGIKRILKTVLPDDIIVKMKKVWNWQNNWKMLDKSKKTQRFQKGKYPAGINLIGDIKAETGLGQSMRIIAAMIEHSGIPFVIKQVNAPGGLEHNDCTWAGKIGDGLLYGINLIHINPNTWAERYNSFRKEELDYRYNIAYWLWELEEFPDEWVPCIATVDEIWTPSEFISRSIRQKTDKTVRTIPYAITIEHTPHLGRDYFHLPEDKFFCLIMYDFKSMSERKNPEAAVRAFIQAFKPTEGVGLIIKINHLKNRKELEKLKSKVESYPDVYYITDNLSRQEVESLIAVSDVMISLHRSEGFGLPLAEAMYLGTPVVATNWSANTEFMGRGNACLVDYQLVKLPKAIGPYKKGSIWAAADEEQAAGYMRKLYYDSAYYASIKENGRRRIEEQLPIGAASKLLKEAVEEIYL